MDENNVVPLPLPTVAKRERRPSRPREYRADCYSWISATTTRKGHWRLNRYAVLRHEVRPARDRGSGSQAGGPGHLPDDPQIARDRNESASIDRSTDDACRHFFRVRRRIASADEKAFYEAHDRWPVCLAELDQWVDEERLPVAMVVNLVVGIVVAIGSMLTIWLA